MKKWHVLLFLVCSLHALAQHNYCIENRFSQIYYFDSSQIIVHPEVTYGIAQRWPSTTPDTLRMDFFEPAPTADTLPLRPFILLIHGGAFLAGNKTDMYYQCMEYARRGFVVATMSYRLGWNCPATDLLGVCVWCQGQNYALKTAAYRAVQDARAAMRYVYAHGADYNIDTSWLFIGGESAGASTALHTAFWEQAEADSFVSFATAQVGLLDTSGNALPGGYTIKGVIDNCGAVSRDSVVLNNSNVAVISFHDEGDCVVPANAGQVISCVCQPFFWAWGSSSIHQLMANAGRCNEMHLVPLSVNHCSYPAWNLVRQASCFLKRVMCGDCPDGFSADPAEAAVCDTLHRDNATGFTLKVNSENSLLFYPNPTTGWITFDLSNYTAFFPLTVKCFGPDGQLKFRQDGVNEVLFRTPLAGGQTGLHIVKLYARQKEVAEAKVVLE